MLRPLLLLTLVASACAADAPFSFPEAARAPIYQGTASSTGATVALTFSGQGSFCSGTLITPTVVLTAAHCLEGIGSNITYVEVYFGPDADGAGQRVSAIRGMMHPDYDGYQMIADIGAVELASAGPVTPIPHLTADIGLTSADEGTALRFAGFGETESGGYGRRLEVDGVLGTVCNSANGCPFNGYYIGYGTFGYPQSSGGPCSGDSGGPAYMMRGGTEYVVGVTSYGEPTCSVDGISTTVDRYDAFLQAFINHEPITVQMCEQPSCMPGQPCASDGTCGPRGVCIDASWDPGFVGGYCSSPCGDNTQCPAGSSCAQGYCWHDCAAPADCRVGYTCYDFGGSGGCFPEQPEPGTTPPGGACASRGDCAGADGWCWNEADYGLPGGLCSWPCSAAGDCPTGTACDGQTQACWPVCLRSSDCRPDWACWADPATPGSGWCMPSCHALAAICEAGEVCNTFGLCGADMPPVVDSTNNGGQSRSGSGSEDEGCAAAPGSPLALLLVALLRRRR